MSRGAFSKIILNFSRDDTTTKPLKIQLLISIVDEDFSKQNQQFMVFRFPVILSSLLKGNYTQKELAVFIKRIKFSIKKVFAS